VGNNSHFYGTNLVGIALINFNMASEYTTTVKLDPFFQRFLRAQFEQENDDVFVFPSRHDFNALLAFLVQPVPGDYSPPNYGDWTFRIALPHMEHKNVETYNYLPVKAQQTFSNKVRRYMNRQFHDELGEAICRHGFTRTEAIDYLAYSFGFLAEDYDRLLKEYQRWRKAENMRKWRRRKRETVK
jgi:hypothetical protein